MPFSDLGRKPTVFEMAAVNLQDCLTICGREAEE
jgi:hypothetical protein